MLFSVSLLRPHELRYRRVRRRAAAPPADDPARAAHTGTRKLFEWLYVIGFAALIAVPIIAAILGVGLTPDPEFRRFNNRAPSTRPVWEWRKSALAAYPREFEKWFCDRYPFRESLITLESAVRLYGLGVSAKPDKVLVGRDGWLFLDIDRMVHQHMGADVFTEDELTQWAACMQARRDWLASRNIPFVLAVAPDKYTIYPEHLPSWVRCAEQTRLDQVKSRLAQSGVEFVDLRQPLQQAKESGKPLYFRMDPHWNNLGAATAYGAVMDCLQSHVPGCRRVPVEQCRFVEQDFEINFGPLQMLGLVGIEQDTQFEVEFPPEFRSDVTVRDERADRVISSQGNPFVYTPEGQQAIMTTTRSDATPGPKATTLLLIRDSYGNAMAPFFSQSFDRTVHVRHSSPAGVNMVDVVTRYKPDAVVYVMVERYLGNPPTGHPSWYQGAADSQYAGLTHLYRGMQLYREQDRAEPIRQEFMGLPGWSLLAHPPTNSVVSVPPEATALSVEFGIYDQAYRQECRTDGVVFRISLRTEGGQPRELWRRHLQPLTDPGDRGCQTARIVLPSEAKPRQLIVETLTGVNPAWDWAYWRDFSFVSEPK